MQLRKVVGEYYGISIGLSVAGKIMSGDLRISFCGHRTDGMDMEYILGYGYVDFRT